MLARNIFIWSVAVALVAFACATPVFADNNWVDITLASAQFSGFEQAPGLVRDCDGILHKFESKDVLRRIVPPTPPCITPKLLIHPGTDSATNIQFVSASVGQSSPYAHVIQGMLKNKLETSLASLKITNSTVTNNQSIAVFDVTTGRAISSQQLNTILAKPDIKIVPVSAIDTKIAR